VTDRQIDITNEAFPLVMSNRRYIYPKLHPWRI